MPPERPERNDLKRLAILGGLALEMAFSVAAGTVIGYFLDKAFGTSPVLTIAFMFVGVVAGVATFVRVWQILKDKIT